MHFLRTPSRLDDQKGATLVESAIVLPFLLMMVVATYDLGGALNQYLILNRIAYEGTRYAATLPGLKIGEFTPASLNPEKHTEICDRIRALIETSDLVERAGYDPDEFSIVTSNVNNNWVTVVLTVNYRSIFGFFNQMPIKISATGPYLSQAPDAKVYAF